VLVLGNEIIGCGGFGDKDNLGIISFAWGLIHNHFHKQGFGKILLKYRLEKINELYPFKTVLLDTTQHSFAFFEKNGFVITKITNDYYTKGMHRYDMIKEK
jgi:ribosomal protein S18 acetylase RimI-like enzyme